jgi:hypothetical protein
MPFTSTFVLALDKVMEIQLLQVMGQPDRRKQLQRESPSDLIKSFCQVNLEHDVDPLRTSNSLSGTLNIAEVIMNLPTLDESTLFRRHHGTKIWREAVSKGFGEDLTKTMDETYGVIVPKRSRVSFLGKRVRSVSCKR